MKLIDVFDKSFIHAENSLKLYRFLTDFKDKRFRSEWRKKFYEAKLYPTWPKKDGLIRLAGEKKFILGSETTMKDFANTQHAYRELLLRSAIAFSMAAFDKMMHEAVLKNFTMLCKNETLDELIQFPLSDSYHATQAARKRTGKGGKVKPRPAVILKEKAAELLFRETLLGTRRIEQVTAGLGITKVWKNWGAARTPVMSGEESKKAWSKVYHRRNLIVHEVDSVRQLKSRAIKFHSIDLHDAEFCAELTKDLAHFIARRV